jgi:hypothetical protein
MNYEEKIMGLNYWKLLLNKENQSLNNLGNIVLIMHNSIEFDSIIEISNKLANNNILLYISLNKTYDSIKPKLIKFKSKIFIIDCVSDQLFEREPTNNCIFTKAPNLFSELLPFIKESCNSLKPNYILIDSISIFDFSNRIGRQTFYDSILELKTISKEFNTNIVLLHDEIITRNKIPTYSYFSSVLKIEKQTEWINYL